MLKIIADKNIPYLSHWFAPLGDLRAVDASAITPQTVADADVLLVRSTTTVESSLLSQSNVQFVGTASSGSDHLDTHWLDAQGIVWRDTKGCNAEAVAQYIVSSLARLQQWGYLPTRQWRIGLIGLGHVGQSVQQKLASLDCHLLCHDPFIAMSDPDFIHTPLEALQDLDVLSLHVPLTTTGPFPTQHMVDDTLLQCLRAGGVLINTSRGGVINTQALWRSGRHARWCFDVWPNEPQINNILWERVLLGTPHVAGYSQLAKKRASLMLLFEMMGHFQMDCLQPLGITQTQTNRTIIADSWQQAVLQVYDPKQDDFAMRQTMNEIACDRAQAFESMRQQYPLRTEWSECTIQRSRPELENLLQCLGFQSSVAIAK